MFGTELSFLYVKRWLHQNVWDHLKKSQGEKTNPHFIYKYLRPKKTLLFFQSHLITINNMSHIVRKPVYTICKQQRRRSACASAQSDQHLCCLLSGWYNTSNFYIQNFTPLCSWEGWFESWLANPEDRFSRVVAYLITINNILNVTDLYFRGRKSFSIKIFWIKANRNHVGA